MHLTWFFLKKWATALSCQLTGTEAAVCFSQNKDELVIGFAHPDQDFYLKAALSGPLTGLEFTDNFGRARRNSINLMTDIIGQKVKSVQAIDYDRSFYITFEDGCRLLFKMHGNRSNIILLKEQNGQNNVVSVFNQKLKKDYDISPEQLSCPADWSHEAFEAVNGRLKDFCPQLGKVAFRYLKDKGYSDASLSARWALLQPLLEEALQPAVYHIVQRPEQSPEIWLWTPDSQDLTQLVFHKTYKDPLEAATQLMWQLYKFVHVEQRKQQLSQSLKKRMSQTKTYLNKLYKRLDELQNNLHPGQTADLIMAHLHDIPSGASQAKVQDFYRGGTTIIKLKPTLSAQKNAESYYRKEKNRKHEVETIEQNLVAREEQQTRWQHLLSELDTLETPKAILQWQKDHFPEHRETEEETFPFRQFVHNNYNIWVGRGAANNDLLTQRYAHKNDLWLHARSVSGSHVVVKHKGDNKPFPKEVVERAAELAAWFSQARQASLQPVSYTFKKYVRKPKGSAPGGVVLDREEVLMVKPKLN